MRGGGLAELNAAIAECTAKLNDLSGNELNLHLEGAKLYLEQKSVSITKLAPTVTNPLIAFLPILANHVRHTTDDTVKLSIDKVKLESCNYNLELLRAAAAAAGVPGAGPAPVTGPPKGPTVPPTGPTVPPTGPAPVTGAVTDAQLAAARAAWEAAKQGPMFGSAKQSEIDATKAEYNRLLALAGKPLLKGGSRKNKKVNRKSKAKKSTHKRR